MLPPATRGIGDGPRSRSPVLRFLAFVVLLLVAAVTLWALGLVEPETIDRALDVVSRARGAWWGPLALLGLFLLCGPLGLPISPLVATGGAVFGLLGGWTINLLGAWGAAWLSYELGRGFGRGVVARLAGPKRTAALGGVLDRHGFWALVRVRFLPLPFGAVNYAAALIGIRRAPFVASTAAGLAVPLLVFTQLGSVLASAAGGQRAAAVRQAVWLLLLFFTVSFAPLLWRRLRRPREATIEPPEYRPAASATDTQADSQRPAREDRGAERETGREQSGGADQPEPEPPDQ
jgi:uncharacterized membrane protein YdjX (TVP38/TMEM64 family)